MLRSVIGFIIIAVTCGCRAETRSEAGRVSQSDPQEVRRAIDSANAKITAWIAAGQADSVVTLFAKDAQQMPPGSPPFVGRDSIQRAWTNNLKGGKWQFDLKTDDVVVADSIAVEKGHYTLKVAANAGSPMPSFEDRGNYIVTWQRESDAQWRILWDIAASTNPMPGTPAPTPKTKSTR